MFYSSIRRKKIAEKISERDTVCTAWAWEGRHVNVYETKKPRLTDFTQFLLSMQDNRYLRLIGGVLLLFC